jgi:hypothetical protein
MIRVFDQVGRWAETRQIGAALTLVFVGVVGFGVAFGLVFMSQLWFVTSGMNSGGIPKVGAMPWVMLLAAIAIGPAGAASALTGGVLALFVLRKPTQSATRPTETRGA